MNNWIELAVVACDHSGLKYRSIETLVTWDQEYCSNAVYRLDAKQYLKIFGPRDVRQFYLERAILQTLEDHPIIPAPRIIASAERLGDAPYLVLTGIDGATAEDVWDEIAKAERLPIARELGTITAAIHRLSLENLAAVEKKWGGRHEHIIKPEQTRRIAEIEATETLSLQQRDDLLRFLHEEAQEHLAGPLKVVYFDLAHNHIYLTQNAGSWQVNGIIDWGEAIIGTPEWDVVYLWHWTFTTISQDRAAMQTCLQSLFAEHHRPERFAQRCFAALLHTPSMPLLWPYAVAQAEGSRNIVRDLTKFFYPPNVFGPPD